MQLNREKLPIVGSLKDNLRDCKSVLDLGCGQSSMLQYVPGIERSLGVEVWEPYINESKKHKIHTNYQRSDLKDFSTSQTFDAVICIDVIEHIPKDEAINLIKKMITWADKKVVIFVPNGFMPQDDPYQDGNKHQEHVSEWSPADLNRLGFSVYGCSGWKPLRGPGANIIIDSPAILRYLLAGVSLFSEPICWIHPDHAFALLAIYTKEGN